MKGLELFGDLRFQLNVAITFPFTVPYRDLGLDKYVDSLNKKTWGIAYLWRYGHFQFIASVLSSYVGRALILINFDERSPPHKQEESRNS